MVLSSHTNRTVADALAGQGTIVGNGLLVLAGSLLIAILAQIAVPIGPVPISGQTLGVLLVAAVLGPKRGAGAVALYSSRRYWDRSEAPGRWLCTLLKVLPASPYLPAAGRGSPYSLDQPAGTSLVSSPPQWLLEPCVEPEWTVVP